MKKIPLILMILAPYLLLGAIHFGSENAQILCMMFVYSVMFLGALNAFLLPQSGYRGDQILLWGVVLKIAYLPLTLCFFLAGIGLFPEGFYSRQHDGFFLRLWAYCLVLHTSLYGISGLRRCVIKKRLSLKTALFHGLLQLVLLVDVPNALYCYRKSKNKDGQV